MTAILMIIGHEPIRERLRRAAKRKRTAQAYLFVGPENVGKLAVAKELAELLVGGASLSDMAVLRPERVEEKGKVRERPIGVEKIREATRMLGLSHATGAGKILIVDDAHRLTEEAQSAFLKTLEEPFPGTTIFLVTHEEGAILPTIVSRTERVSFGLVPKNEISEHFPTVSSVFRKLGRPGLAVSFQENPESYEEHIRVLESLLSFESLSFSNRVKCAELFSNDIPYAERMLSWWIGGLEHSVSSAADTKRRRQFLELIQNVSATLRDLRRFPGSARLTIEHLLFFGRSVSPFFPTP